MQSQHRSCPGTPHSVWSRSGYPLGGSIALLIRKDLVYLADSVAAHNCLGLDVTLTTSRMVGLAVFGPSTAAAGAVMARQYELIPIPGDRGLRPRVLQRTYRTTNR